tara:strand:+ start:147 stop:395 length:249 start_codon:yes stop_codon:yes gene_type:complete
LHLTSREGGTGTSTSSLRLTVLSSLVIRILLLPGVQRKVRWAPEDGEDVDQVERERGMGGEGGPLITAYPKSLSYFLVFIFY